MSRIRSVHPGLWTDERFVSVSPLARLLFIGLWNECDDQGSFEWSPIKLKMRLLAADNADAAALLDELVGAGCVMRYELEGRQLGAVRNFCRFQRPKKPNSIYPQTDEVRKWVDNESRSTRDGGEEVGNQFGTDGGNYRQMKEEGGRREDEGGNREEPRKRVKLASKPADVSDDVWSDFQSLRRQKQAPLTETALKGIAREAVKAGWTLSDALRECCERGWQGFKADWVNKGKGNGNANGSRPSGWLA